MAKTTDSPAGSSSIITPVAATAPAPAAAGPEPRVWGMPESEPDPDPVDRQKAEAYRKGIYTEAKDMQCMTASAAPEAKKTGGARLLFSETLTGAVIAGMRGQPQVAPEYSADALDVQLGDRTALEGNLNAHQDAVTYYGFTLAKRDAHLGAQVRGAANKFRTEAQRQLLSGHIDPAFMVIWRPIDTALQDLQAQKDKTVKGKDDAIAHIQVVVDKLTATVDELQKRLIAKDAENAQLRLELAGQPIASTPTHGNKGHKAVPPTPITNVPPGPVTLPGPTARKTPR